MAICQTQWRAGFGGAYGLDYGVIIQTAAALGIETGQIFFEKIRVYENEALKIIRGGAKAKQHCDEKQKEKCRIEFGEFFEWACLKCSMKRDL